MQTTASFCFSSSLPTESRTAISREHAILRVGGDGTITLTDLGGLNGTYLGKTRLRPHVPEVWHVGAEAIFGGGNHVEPGATWKTSDKALVRVYAFQLQRRETDTLGSNYKRARSEDAVTEAGGSAENSQLREENSQLRAELSQLRSKIEHLLSETERLRADAADAGARRAQLAARVAEMGVAGCELETQTRLLLQLSAEVIQALR